MSTFREGSVTSCGTLGTFSRFSGLSAEQDEARRAASIGQSPSTDQIESGSLSGLKPSSIREGLLIRGGVSP